MHVIAGNLPVLQGDNQIARLLPAGSPLIDHHFGAEHRLRRHFLQIRTVGAYPVDVHTGLEVVVGEHRCGGSGGGTDNIGFRQVFGMCCRQHFEPQLRLHPPGKSGGFLPVAPEHIGPAQRPHRTDRFQLCLRLGAAAEDRRHCAIFSRQQVGCSTGGRSGTQGSKGTAFHQGQGAAVGCIHQHY